MKIISLKSSYEIKTNLSQSTKNTKQEKEENYVILVFGRQNVWQNPVVLSPWREGTSNTEELGMQDNPRILPICGQTSAFAIRHLHWKSLAWVLK